MKIVNRAVRWFKLGDAGTPAARALVIEQFKSLARQFPTLFLFIIVDTLSIVYALPASVPWSLRSAVPSGMVILSLIRLAHWLKLKTATPSAEAAFKQLRKTRMLVAVLNLAFSAWALALFEVVDDDLRMMVSLLVFMAAVGSAYCLGSFPSAARFTLLISALPISLRLLASGNTTLVCVGINLCLLLLLLVRMLNIYYSGFVKLVASRARLVAERERSRNAEIAARDEQAKTRQIAARFDTALNNMSQGLCFFDGQRRLIVCNRRYIDMYGLPPDSVQAGTTLREIVDLRFAAGSFPKMTKDEYLAWRDNVAVSDKPSDTVVHLNNGRVFEIRHRPMRDRGWVATHEDVTERYLAQQALADAKAAAERAGREARIAHARLVDALDAIPEGLAVFDDQDRYVLWNRQYANIYTDTRDVLAPGKTFEQTVRAGLARGQYPEAKGREVEWLEERLARHALPQSTHEQQLPGDRWLRIEERRTTDGGRIGVRVDITDLKRREASFRLLFEANPLPMWVVDVESLTFVAANDAACRRYGYSREAFLAMTADELRRPEERERLREEYRATNGEYGNGTIRQHVTADGTMIDVAVETRPLIYNGRSARVAVAFDMTERLRAEGELRQTREFLDTVIESVPVTIFVKDVREQRYVLSNQAAARYLGISAGELIGKTAHEMFSKESADRIAAHDRQVLESRQPSVINELPMDTPGNGRRIVNWTSLLIPDRHGAPQYIMRVVEDVTDRKQAEQPTWRATIPSPTSPIAAPSMSILPKPSIGADRPATPSRCCASISTVSRRSTICSGIRSATRCCARRRGACARRRRARSWRGSVATSSC
jgi:PAS domain S-box-containing protein